MAWWTLFKRELSSYFHSGVAYTVLLLSAIVQGFVFVILTGWMLANQVTQANVMQVFFAVPFFWVLLFLQVPLITMRLFSEELKLGTIEMLLTAPVTDWDVVIAKFFGALVFYIVLWLPIALDLTVLQLFSSPPPPVYWSQIGLTTMTMVLLGAFYVSIGVFASTLTRNQIIAAVLCFALLFIPFGVSMLKGVFQNLDATKQAWISYVSTPEHLQIAGQGVFDSRPVIYYLTATILMLYLAKSVVESRRLKS